MPFPTPQWVRDAVFYHIFPERFANGDTSNDPPGTVPWGSTPTIDNFMGGDLQGILDRLDYLQDLGVTAIYLNPIFKARSNHKFDHGDYMLVDPHFGTNDLFRRFVNAAHGKNIRVILDISHNHSGREFFAFRDVIKNGEVSPYKDWYDIRSFPVSDAENPNYRSWWGIGTLPEFNTDNPAVRSYFLDVTRYWMEEMGIDGWRLDVANEVPHDYWVAWRELVKSINPDAYTVGEIWGDGSPWLKGDNFDAVMNYVWRDAVMHFFIQRSINVYDFHARISELLQRHGQSVSLCMFNLLGSHDTPRIITEANGDLFRVRLAYVYQMTYPGAPVLYYGDEIGMTGGKDPGCRKAFPWNEASWDKSLRAFIQSLIRLRRQLPGLRSYDYESVSMRDNEGVYVYRRGTGADTCVVALNNSDEAQQLSVEVGTLWDRDTTAVQDHLTGVHHAVEGGHVTMALNGCDAVVLTPVS